MEEQLKRVLDKEKSIALLDLLSKDLNLSYVVDANTAIFKIKQQESIVGLFKKPLLFPDIKEDFQLIDYLENLQKSNFNHLILLGQASGNVALAYYEKNDLQKHKVIRKYTQRKKQGKAQIKHLKTKGKSRLGSRIRLQQTEQLFEETHQKIKDWEVIENCEHILYHCDISFWQLLMSSKYKPSFNKDDLRLKKIPLDLETPTLKVLQYVHKYSFKSYISFDKQFVASNEEIQNLIL